MTRPRVSEYFFRLLILDAVKEYNLRMPGDGTQNETGRKIGGFDWIPWILLPLIFILYASHPTKRFYFDGVVFASIIEHGPFDKLFNPHHLLYTWVFYLITHATEQILGHAVRALYVMQWGNIFLGTICLGFIWKIILRLVDDRGFALLVTLLGCFSFTYWHYSTDANVYFASLLFLLLAADRLEIVLRHRPPRNSDFVFIGLMQALSVLFHQLNVFWAVCVIGCLIFGLKNESKRDRIKWAIRYLAFFALPVIAAYLIAGIFVCGNYSLSKFSYWITEYGHQSRFWVSDWKTGVYLTLSGYMAVFFNRYNFQEKFLGYNIQSAMEEGRLFKALVRQVFGYYSLAFLFYCYLSALYNINKYLYRFPKRSIFVIFWLAPYVIFQFFFMPSNSFYRLFIYIPLLAVFAWFGTVEIKVEKLWFKWPLYALFIVYTGIGELRLGIILALFILAFEIFKKRKTELYRWGLFILVAFLPLYNYYSGILPESRLENNPEVVSAIQLADDFKTGDLLVFEGGFDYPDGWIISALTNAKIITLAKLKEMGLENQRVLFTETLNEGGRIFIHPNITEKTRHIEICARNMGITVEELLSTFDEYEFREGFEENGRKYYELAMDRN